MLALIEFGHGARSDFACRSVRGSLQTHDTTCVPTPPTRSTTFSGPGRADSEHGAGKPHFQPPRPAGPAELQRPGEREQDPERQTRRRVGCSSPEWAPRAGEPACLAGFLPPRGSGGPETRQQTPLPPPPAVRLPSTRTRPCHPAEGRHLRDRRREGLLGRGREQPALQKCQGAGQPAGSSHLRDRRPSPARGSKRGAGSGRGRESSSGGGRRRTPRTIDGVGASADRARDAGGTDGPS